MLRGVKVFFKRNKIQLIIAFICILITIKQMNTPFLFEYNWLTEILFKKLPSEHYLSEILDILGNLAFAYYSGLIFYYIVEYFPARRKEKQALFFANEHLSELSKNIACLIEDLFFVAKLTYPDKKKGLLFTISQIELTFDKIYCDRDLFCGNPEINVESSKGELLIPCIKIQEDCTDVINTIEVIKKQIYSNQLEEDITEILNILENNNYIRGIKAIDSKYLSDNNMVFCSNFKLLDIAELLYINRLLRKLPIDAYRCELRLSKENDVEEIKEILEEVREINPVAVKKIEELLK